MLPFQGAVLHVISNYPRRCHWAEFSWSFRPILNANSLAKHSDDTEALKVYTSLLFKNKKYNRAKKFAEKVLKTDKEDRQIEEILHKSDSIINATY